MEYLRVKPEYDQRPTNKGVLVANEIYTFREWQKLRDSAGRKLPMACFDQIEISKNSTYFFFGARFVAPSLSKELECIGYTISHEYSGSGKMYVVRYAGTFVGSCNSENEGKILAEYHNKKRKLAYGLY